MQGGRPILREGDLVGGKSVSSSFTQESGIAPMPAD
jgi:hypothetical protein